jgi:hypothetical protein
MYRNDRGSSCLIHKNALQGTQEMCLADKEKAGAEDTAKRDKEKPNDIYMTRSNEQLKGDIEK